MLACRVMSNSRQVCACSYEVVTNLPRGGAPPSHPDCMKPTFPPLTPSPGLLPIGANQSIRAFQERRSVFAARDTQDAFSKTDTWLSQFTETNITVNGRIYTVLARTGGVDETTSDGSQAPWRMVKGPNRICTIYPSAIWDGKGNSVWCSYEGTVSTAESSLAVELPVTPLHGYIWLECTVSDTDDDHGLLISAKIKAGGEVAFNSRDGLIVNIALGQYFITNTVTWEYTLDPVRGFVFVLRRYGPPTSITWDVEPL